MQTMRIVEKPSFLVCGKKIWISGQRNEEFADFWAGTHGSGLIDRLRRLTGPIVMEKSLLGISRVEKDPAHRAFYFYIACEVRQNSSLEEQDLECFTVPASRWAVFSNYVEKDSLGEALIEAELSCHMTWLPNSNWRRVKAPEIEVYPETDGTLVEYWLPIEEKT